MFIALLECREEGQKALRGRFFIFEDMQALTHYRWTA